MKLIHLTEVRITRNWRGRTTVQTKRTGETRWSDHGVIPRGKTITINCHVEAHLDHLWTVE